MSSRSLSVLAIIVVFSVRALAAGLQTSELIGEWTGTTKDGVKITYRFLNSESVIWLVDEPHFKSQAPSGLKAKYTVREKSPFWEIDIGEFEDSRFRNITFEAILKLTSKTEFKLEGRPTNRGGRPKLFSDEAVVFSKVAANQQGSANGGQPSGSNTNRDPAADARRRSP